MEGAIDGLWVENGLEIAGGSVLGTRKVCLLFVCSSVGLFLCGEIMRRCLSVIRMVHINLVAS